jgi:hypothetical protein
LRNGIALDGARPERWWATLGVLLAGDATWSLLLR